MSGPFSTNELFLRSDRIAFGKLPTDTQAGQERIVLVPSESGDTLYFGLSSMTSTITTLGNLQTIYPELASFTFDNLHKRLGINVSSPQFALDIQTTTGVRVSGGTLIANASGLFSVPTSAFFSTLPTSVFGPGTIPPNALVSSGSIAGLSVPTSALFSTLPTALFASYSIPLASLQSSGVLVASSFVGDGFFLSNIPLANINGSITGNFFPPNSIPLSSLASTGQIWIRDGSVLAPIMSTGQFQFSSLQGRNISAITVRTGSLITDNFLADNFTASNISAISVKASSIEALFMISSARIFGDGQSITNLNPAELNTVIPSDKFGYRLIAMDALNPFGDFVYEAGTWTYKRDVTVNIEGIFTVSSIKGDGSQLTGIPYLDRATLFSSIAGLGTLGYVSSSQLASTVAGLTIAVTSSIQATEIASTIIGLGSIGYVSTSQLVSTTLGLQTSGFLSSPNLLNLVSTPNLLDLVSSPNLLDLVSTPNLLNLVSTPNLLDLVSSPNLLNLISTPNLLNLVSTPNLLDLVSSPNLLNLVSTPNLLNLVSTPNLLDLVSTPNLLDLVSTPNLLNLVSTPNLLDLVSSPNLLNLVSTPNLLNLVSTQNLLDLVSSPNLLNLVSTQVLFSTVAGLGEIYVSTPSLVSTLGAYLSSFSTAFGPGGGTITSSNINSTVAGLGTAGYVSTLSLTSSINAALSSFSTAFGPGGGTITSSNINSTIQGLGTLGFISTQTLQSTLVSTTAGLERYISSFIDPAELTSSVLQFISSTFFQTQLTSTVAGLGTSGYVSTLSMNSSIQTAISSFSTALGTVGSGNLSLGNLQSTVAGLGTTGYVSSIRGLVSTPNLLNVVSTPNLLNLVSTPNLLNLISSPNLLNLVSSANLLGLVSTPYLSNVLTSTVIGLGTVGYISSLSLRSSLVSTVAGLNLTSLLPPFLSSFTVSTGSVSASSITTIQLNVSSTASISSLTVNSLQFGDGTGWVNLGPLQTVALSSIQVNTSSLYANSGNFGYVSTQFATVSSLVFLDPYLGTPNYLAVSSGSLLLNGAFLTGSGGSGGGLTTQNLVSTVGGLGSAGYISSIGGLVSTPNLLNLVSSPNLLNLVSSPNLLNLVSSPNLLNLVSSPNLLNLVSTSFLDTQLASTVRGLGSSRYVSSFFNISSISAQQLLVSSIGIGCNSPSYQLDILGSGHANIFSSLLLQTSSYTGNLGDAQTLILWEV